MKSILSLFALLICFCSFSQVVEVNIDKIDEIQSITIYKNILTETIFTSAEGGMVGVSNINHYIIDSDSNSNSYGRYIKVPLNELFNKDSIMLANEIGKQIGHGQISFGNLELSISEYGFYFGIPMELGTGASFTFSEIEKYLAK